MVTAVATNLLVLAPAWPQHRGLVLLDTLVSVVFVAAGLALRADPDQRSNGNLLLLTGLLGVLPSLSCRDVGPLALISWLFGPLALLPLAVVLLRYPGARLSKWWEWWWVGVIAVWLPVGRLAAALFPSPRHVQGWWPPAVLHGDTARTVVDGVSNAGGALLALLVPIMLVHRLWRAPALDRRTMAPVAVAATASGLATGMHLASFLWGEEFSPTPAVLEVLALLSVPVSFLVVGLARRLSQAAVAGVLLDLPASATPADLRVGLARALRDPRLNVLYWLPEERRYVDTYGRPADPAAVDPGRMSVPAAASDGSPLAVVVIEAGLDRHRELLAAVLRLSTLALENTRLQAALLARLREVRESRARLAESSLAERRRVERDLHDGAQQRLLALAASLGRLRTQVTNSSAQALVDEARSDLRLALQELRDLARGIHPALLTQAGLKAAVEGIAARLPLAVDIDVPTRRWPPDVEATAYFLVCEALANVAKHAGVGHAQVSVTETSHYLAIAVADHGVGSADPDTGSGLRGLRDRVAALGGQLQVVGDPGSGTRVEATLPCG